MKIKSAIFSVILCLCTLFGIVGLSGCGEVSLKTLAENFDDLQAVYSTQTVAGVFRTGDCEGVQTKYLVSYGDIVDGYVASDKDEYVELLEKYNIMLVVSSDYIDNNKNYIISITKENLTKNAQNAINELNKSLVDYKNYISTFVRERQALINYFSLNNDKLSENDHLINLRKFKKSYGALVEKNVDLSMKLAKCVETTEIFELLKKAEPTVEDTKIVKEYLRAKMLPIYSEFMLGQLENKLYWKGTKETETKTRINELLDKLDDSFDAYKTRFVSASDSTLKALTSKNEMTQLLDYIDDFFVEVDAYFEALRKLNISKLAISFDNDLTAYKKSNALAEVCLEKLEQFVGTSIENFTTKVASMMMN